MVLPSGIFSVFSLHFRFFIGHWLSVRGRSSILGCPWSNASPKFCPATAGHLNAPGITCGCLTRIAYEPA
jgi:hypothetical protein